MGIKVNGLILLWTLATVATAAAAAEQIREPDMELLEFLGEWETDDGQWFDPIEKASDATDEEDSHDES